MEESDDASQLDPKLAPLLLFYHNNSTFLYSMPTRTLLPAGSGDDISDMLRRHLCWTTPQGWLLMARPATPDTLLWDPFTRRGFVLPPDTDGDVFHRRGRHLICLLSRSRPTDPGCVVLVVDLTEPVLWYCRPSGDGGGGGGGGRDRNWVKHEYLQPGTLHHELRDIVHSSMGSITAINGKFYVDVINKSYVVVLEFSPEPVFTLIDGVDSKDRIGRGYTRHSKIYVESDGELYCVYICHPIRCDRIVARVVVYKLDVMAKGSTWVKASSLGGRAIIVLPGRFVVASFNAVEAGLEANCIYYWLEGQKALYVYNMERGTTAVYNPGADLPNHLSPVLVVMPIR
uniref:KIB1-4 beta-propeller domain-containing protein n=1 Tax=Leersia perrieri TaxID=77586 RepID=A0A0D9XDC7_9ORYZ